jgi:hypothetical protein
VFGDARPGTEPSCMIPADFLRSVGFKTVRPHPRWPRLRMELRSAMTWKEDVEAALEQLLGSISLPLQSTGIGEVPRRPVRTPAPTGLSGALRARSEGRCRVIRSGAE